MAEDEARPGASQAGERAPDFRPLYSQVRELLIRRMVSGAWGPGEALPSEARLAAEFGVSQGTVRKALDDMAAQNLLVRQQGRGTFVATHTHQRAQFHFLRIVADTGGKELPTSRIVSLKVGRASRAQRDRLRLPAGARVYSLLRRRAIRGVPVILERIALPAALFPGLDLPLDHETPDELYVLYERKYAVTVVCAEERLRAVAADAVDAQHLGVAAGAPLLEVDRIALSLDGIPAEWRVSRCDTACHHYASIIA